MKKIADKVLKQKHLIRKVNIKRILLSLTFFLSQQTITVPLSFAAAGMQTKFGSITIENLQPGITYNTRELVNMPLIVKNTGDGKLVVKIETVPPKPDSPGLIKAGCEVIPDPSCVKFSKDELEIAPGGSEGTDILITIPDDDKYLGKRYQVDISLTQVNRGFIGIGLLANLRFSVAYRRQTKEEADLRKKVEEFGTFDFELLPKKQVLENVPLGKEIDIEKDFKTSLKISNPNDVEFLYYMDLVTFRDVDMLLPGGFEELPRELIILKEKDVKVPENTVKKVKLGLKIPNEEKYKNKKFAFCVRGTVAGAPVELSQISRFIITTKE